MEAVAPSSIDLAGSGPFYRGDKTKARWEGSKMARNRLKPGMPAASGSPIESAGRLHVAGHVSTNQLINWRDQSLLWGDKTHFPMAGGSPPYQNLPVRYILHESATARNGSVTSEACQ
jgi:hypothetical protein